MVRQFKSIKIYPRFRKIPADGSSAWAPYFCRALKRTCFLKKKHVFVSWLHVPLCFLAPSGSGVLTHPRQADQAICFPGLCAEKRCRFLRPAPQNPHGKPEASLPRYLCVIPAGEDRGGCGRGWMGTARPAKPPLPLGWGDSIADTCSVSPASYSLADHLQREASAPAPPGFNRITLYLEITLPPLPPSKTGCFTPTSVLLRIFLVRHLRSLPIRHPVYNQTFSVGFFYI